MGTVENILLLFFLLMLIVDDKLIKKIYVGFFKLYRVWMIAIAAIFILTRIGREYLFENTMFAVCLWGSLVDCWVYDYFEDTWQRFCLIYTIVFMLYTVYVLYIIWFI